MYIRFVNEFFFSSDMGSDHVISLKDYLDFALSSLLTFD